EVYLASYTLGDFKISYFKMGPTELRLLLAISNLALLWKSTVHLAERLFKLFKVDPTIGISCIFSILLISVFQNTHRPYSREPLTQNPKPSPQAQPARPKRATRAFKSIFGASQR